MVSAGETDANLWALKSRACRSAWGPVLPRLSMQNEVKQHPSGMTQATERHLLLLSPPLSIFETSKIFLSHPKAFKGCHDTWERPFSWYHCIESNERGYWVAKLKACSGRGRAWLTIILFSGRCPKLQVLALLRWDRSLPQQSLQRLAKEKWSKMQVPMKILGYLLLLLYLYLLKEKCCIEKLVTWPSNAFVVMAMDCSSAWPWEVTHESELFSSHSTWNHSSKGKSLAIHTMKNSWHHYVSCYPKRRKDSPYPIEFSPVASELSF